MTPRVAPLIFLTILPPDDKTLPAADKSAISETVLQNRHEQHHSVLPNTAVHLADAHCKVDDGNRIFRWNKCGHLENYRLRYSNGEVVIYGPSRSSCSIYPSAISRCGRWSLDRYRFGQARA